MKPEYEPKTDDQKLAEKLAQWITERLPNKGHAKGCDGSDCSRESCLNPWIPGRYVVAMEDALVAHAFEILHATVSELEGLLARGSRPPEAEHVRSLVGLEPWRDSQGPQRYVREVFRRPERLREVEEMIEEAIPLIYKATDPNGGGGQSVDDILRDLVRQALETVDGERDEIQVDKLIAERAEKQLRDELAVERAVCICGCPPGEHESYGDEGETCENESHECIRVAVAVAQIAANMSRRSLERQAGRKPTSRDTEGNGPHGGKW